MSEQPARLDGLSGVLLTPTSVVDAVGSKLPPDPTSVLALIQERDALKKRVAELEAHVPRWIPVTERLPEKWRNCLTLSYEGYIAILEFRWWLSSENDGWFDLEDYKIGGITHWMPLPPPPKESK